MKNECIFVVGAGTAANLFKGVVLVSLVVPTTAVRVVVTGVAFSTPSETPGSRPSGEYPLRPRIRSTDKTKGISTTLTFSFKR